MQKVNDSGMDDGPPSPLPETSIQEPGSSARVVRPEAPVDTMLKDMATIIFSTFLLAGWVAFVITYPKVSQTTPPGGLLSACKAWKKKPCIEIRDEHKYFPLHSIIVK